MRLGIVGLPNVGKSTLFNALTKLNASVSNFPFTTINPNIGIVAVFDERLDKLAGIVPHEKLTYTTVEFVDIAGLVKGASKGEGLGNQFLSHIREVDGIVHVIRCFEDSNISHVSGDVDPVRDMEVVNTELNLADLDYVEKAIVKVDKKIKGLDKKAVIEKEMLLKIRESLNKGIPIRNVVFNEEEKEFLKEYFFLSLKPVLYVANTSERLSPKIEELKKNVKEAKAELVQVYSKLELEVGELPEEEAKQFLEEYGIKEISLRRLVSSAYRTLGLITYFTVKEPEIKAWSIKEGTKAPQAAGKIHSDFEKGFISAEVINWEELLNIGSWLKAKQEGILKGEGKEYTVKDGDVIQFKFAI